MIDPGIQNETRAARRQRMVAEMSNWPTIKWVLVAAALHLVLITATSTAQISELAHAHGWFGLQPLPVAPLADADKAPTLPEPPAPATKPAATVGNKPGMSEDEKKIAELSKGGNVEAKKLTDTAKPSELPKAPSQGLKINEDP